MTGKEIYLLGTASEAARACIPLHLQQTAPRLLWKDNSWVAQFWYYALDSETMTVSAPQFYLELELPGGHPIEMKRLSPDAVCLGDGSMILDPSFHLFIEDYLNNCTALLEGTLDQQQIKKLRQQWEMVHPFPMAVWFRDHVADLPTESFDKQEPVDPLLKQDPVAYWKKVQVKAIREGDDAAAQKARLEMNKAAAMMRK